MKKCISLILLTFMISCTSIKSKTLLNKRSTASTENTLRCTLSGDSLGKKRFLYINDNYEVGVKLSGILSSVYFQFLPLESPQKIRVRYSTSKQFLRDHEGKKKHFNYYDLNSHKNLILKEANSEYFLGSCHYI